MLSPSRVSERADARTTGCAAAHNNAADAAAMHRSRARIFPKHEARTEATRAVADHATIGSTPSPRARERRNAGTTAWCASGECCSADHNWVKMGSELLRALVSRSHDSQRAGKHGLEIGG
jgi:hypothetical protein